jgi:hypothetical protein
VGRLTTLLRVIWIIPIAIVASLLSGSLSLATALIVFRCRRGSVEPSGGLRSSVWRGAGPNDVRGEAEPGRRDGRVTRASGTAYQ